MRYVRISLVVLMDVRSGVRMEVLFIPYTIRFTKFQSKSEVLFCLYTASAGALSSGS
jgi:hypothetical protein